MLQFTIGERRIVNFCLHLFVHQETISFSVVQPASQLLPHIIIIMREGTQTVNAMLSFCDQDRMIMIIIFVHHDLP